MSIKPILFNTDMVRGLSDNRKTATRRVVKPQPKGHAALLTKNLLPETVECGAGAVYAFEDGTVTSPPYRPGDILYVRETWTHTCIHCKHYPDMFFLPARLWNVSGICV